MVGGIERRVEEPLVPDALRPAGLGNQLGMQKQNVVATLGYSILNRTCKINVGSLMLKYGGGGHHAAGTCQVANDQALVVLKELIAHINADENSAG